MDFVVVFSVVSFSSFKGQIFMYSCSFESASQNVKLCLCGIISVV